MKVKKIKPIYFLAVAIVACSGLTIASHLGTAGQLETESSIYGTSRVIEFDADSLQDMRHDDADKVINVITNMQNGDVTAPDAKDYIFEEQYFARKVIDCTPEEMEINNRYIEFLNSAEEVTEAFMYSSPDLQDKIDLMNAKKDLI